MDATKLIRASVRQSAPIRMEDGYYITDRMKLNDLPLWLQDWEAIASEGRRMMAESCQVPVATVEFIRTRDFNYGPGIQFWFRARVPPRHTPREPHAIEILVSEAATDTSHPS